MTTTARQEQIHTQYRPLRSVSVSSIRQLYEVHEACHEQAALDVFLRDLGTKTGIILMTRKSDGRIVGFSTHTVRRQNLEGRAVITVQSDDAEVLPAYWAQCDLAAATRAQLVKMKLRHLLTPLQWCQPAARGDQMTRPLVFDAQSTLSALREGGARWIRQHILRNYRPAGFGRHPVGGEANNSKQHASWQDSSLDEALERGETS